MTSRKTSEIYDTACHVQDADTVIVQGARFVRERTCRVKEGSGYDELNEETFWHLTCGHMSNEWIEPNFCPKCGARVVE